MAQKDLVCPHCKKTLPVGNGGFPHDAELNFICGFCTKVVFAVTAAAETEVKKVIPPAATGMGFNWKDKKEPLPIRIGCSTSVATPEPDVTSVPHEDALDCGNLEHMDCFI